MRSGLNAAIGLPAALGIVSTCAQVILLRELLVAFTGNELILSVSLSVWLVSVSLGSFISGHVVRRYSIERMLLRLVIVAFCLALLQAVCIRLIKPLLIGFGEVPSPIIIMVFSALGLTLVGFGLGLVFVLSTCLLESSGYRKPIGLAYGFEAFGSGIAGILLSFLLLERYDPISILAGTTLISTVVAAIIVQGSISSKITKGIVALVAIMLMTTVIGRKIDIATRTWQWRPVKLISTVDTRYGNITVSQREEIFDFYESGLLSFSAPDMLSAEETVHIPLLMHRSPMSVLIIGGGATGVIKEIEKHPSVRSVDYVELDPMLIKIAEKLLPQGWLSSAGITTRPIYGDGRRYVFDTDSTYDVVVLNIGEPLNLHTSRYYTKEFFERTKSILKPGGIISLRVPTEGAYLGGYRARMVAELKITLEACFEEVAIVPGDCVHLIGADDKQLCSRIESLPLELLKRGIDSKFITEAVLKDRLMPLRRSQLEMVINSVSNPKVSKDEHPIALANAISLWSQQFKSGSLLMAMVTNLRLQHYLIGILILAILICFWLSPEQVQRVLGFNASLLLFNVGFTSLFCQVLILFCYQITNGYIYSRIAMIIAAFMFGMGFGSVMYSRREKLDAIWVGRLQTILATMPWVVLFAFEIAKKGDLGRVISDPIFFLSAFLVGGGSGYAFQVSSSLMANHQGSAAHMAGHTYSLDLFGASLAGVLTGFAIIPGLGFHLAAVLVSLYDVICLILMAALVKVSAQDRVH